MQTTNSPVHARRNVVSENQEPEQIRLMKRMVELSIVRTELSAERSYQNAERTLTNWLRTAMALMIFGIAIDRFGLLLRRLPNASDIKWLYSLDLSGFTGIALVALAVLMAASAGLRFMGYAADYREKYSMPAYHGPYLAPIYALMVVLFGSALFVVLLLFAIGA